MAVSTSGLFVIPLLFGLSYTTDTKDKDSQTKLSSIVAQLIWQIRLGVSLVPTKNQVEDLHSELQSAKNELETVQDTLASTEAGLEYTKKELQSTQIEVQSTQEELEFIQSKLQETQKELQEMKQAMEKKFAGSVYIRWGRKTCPPDVSTMIYSGLAGGKFYNESGSGANRLCLTQSPKYDDDVTAPHATGNLYGAEYKLISPDMQDSGVPCAVCLAVDSITLMIPGTFDCPQDWTHQYQGHLASAHTGHTTSEYVCLDKNPTRTENSTTTHADGLLFYYVISKCGSLPCGPYKDNKIVSCVVCSK